MQEDLARGSTGSEQAPPREPSAANGVVLQQILHFVKQEQCARIVADQALRKPELGEPLPARRLVAEFVHLSDAVEGRAQSGREYLAELRLAGAGRSIKQNVDAWFVAAQRTLQQIFYVVSIYGEVIEVRPFEIGRRRGVQKQTGDIDAGVAGCSGQTSEPVGDFNVTVVFNRDESRTDQWRDVTQAGLDGVCGQAKNQGHCPAAEIERVHCFARRREDVVDHGLESRVGLVAQQQFKDVEIRPIESCRLPEPL